MSLDVGEAYFILTTEALLSIAKNQFPEYDQRITINLGWLLEKKTKLQIGAEYRAENYSRDIDPVFFLLTGLVLSL